MKFGGWSTAVIDGSLLLSAIKLAHSCSQGCGN